MEKILLLIPLELLKSPPSRFNYGVPERIISKLNLKIDNSPIIADLISSIVVARDSEIRYLEIGTSIGKTAYLVMALASAIRAPLCCFCLDIEEINPEFARMMELLLQAKLKKISFEQEIFPKRLAFAFNSQHDTDNSLTKIGDNFLYVCGDEYDVSTWSIVADTTPVGGFNCIYSDALHEPSALRFEYSLLKSHRLFCQTSLHYFFDDLEYSPHLGEAKNGIWSSVLAIASDLMGLFSDVRIYGGQVNGWLGQHEHSHGVGLIVATNRSCRL